MLHVLCKNGIIRNSMTSGFIGVTTD